MNFSWQLSMDGVLAPSAAWITAKAVSTKPATTMTSSRSVVKEVTSISNMYTTHIYIIQLYIYTCARIYTCLYIYIYHFSHLVSESCPSPRLGDCKDFAQRLDWSQTFSSTYRDPRMKEMKSVKSDHHKLWGGGLWAKSCGHQSTCSFMR